MFPTADDRNVPHGVLLWVEDRVDNMIEQRSHFVGGEGRMRRQGFGVAVAPSRNDRRKGLTCHANRIDHDIIDAQSFEPEPSHERPRAPSNACIRAGCTRVWNRCSMPQPIQIELARRHVNHAVIFAQHVHPAATPTNTV